MGWSSSPACVARAPPRVNAGPDSTWDRGRGTMRSRMETTLAAAPVRRRSWLWLVGVLVLAYGAYRVTTHSGDVASNAAVKSAAPPIPVVAVPARHGDMPVYLSALGTVTAFNTVTVKSRVD